MAYYKAWSFIVSYIMDNNWPFSYVVPWQTKNEVVNNHEVDDFT